MRFLKQYKLLDERSEAKKFLLVKKANHLRSLEAVGQQAGARFEDERQRIRKGLPREGSARYQDDT